jgi:hypothetical protein
VARKRRKAYYALCYIRFRCVAIKIVHISVTSFEGYSQDQQCGVNGSKSGPLRLFLREIILVKRFRDMLGILARIGMGEGKLGNTRIKYKGVN